MEFELLANSSLEKPIYPPIFSEPFKIVLHILYNLVLVCGVVGNLLVLYVIYSLPRMRTTTNYLLANLALGDLMIASLCVPFTYMSILYGYWPFGKVMCNIVSPFNAIGVFVSAFTLIAISFEKYIAILHPLLPRLRKSRVVWVILSIWGLAGLASLPIAIVSQVQDLPVVLNNENVTLLPICAEFGWKTASLELYYSLALMMIQYFIPLIVLAYTYTRIAYVVWGIQNEKPAIVSGRNGNSEINLNRNSRTDKRSRKAVLLTLAVVVGYTLAWLPYNMDYIISRQSPQFANEYISIICHWLAMAHCFFNPLIYAWINNSFRKAFKDVYKKVICCFNTQAVLSRSKSSFSTTTMSTIRWKSYRKISITPEPFANLPRKNPSVAIADLQKEISETPY